MRINWKKSLLVTVDIVLAVYLLCAFTVFNKPDETARVCTKAKIVVADESSNGFINANEITKRLKSAGLYPLGKLMRDINAREIEEKLKKSPFVKTAQCYKTEDGEVNVSITQLLPVIRVKAENGDDYYLDDKDCIMPNSLYTSDLIIATGNIRHVEEPRGAGQRSARPQHRDRATRRRPHRSPRHTARSQQQGEASGAHKPVCRPQAHTLGEVLQIWPRSGRLEQIFLHRHRV